MDDRQLLEAAAKAAGLTYRDDLWNESRIQRADKLWEAWSPLEDDGDALRLAVRLGLHITNGHRHAWASTETVDATEPFGDDPCAATRRAIVRVAAAIGAKHG